MDHDRDLLDGPRYEPYRVGIGDADHVGIARPDKALEIRELAVDGDHQERVRHVHLAFREKQVLRHDLAARDARHVRYHAFHFMDVVMFQEFTQVVA